MACMADFCRFSCISMWFCHLWSEICVKCHFFSVFLTFFCLFLNDFYCDMFFMLFLLVVENVSFTCLFHFKMMNFLAFLGMFLLQINQICTEIYAEYSKNVSVVWNIWNILCESETIHQKCFFSNEKRNNKNSNSPMTLHSWLWRHKQQKTKGWRHDNHTSLWSFFWTFTSCSQGFFYSRITSDITGKNWNRYSINKQAGMEFIFIKEWKKKKMEYIFQ